MTPPRERANSQPSQPSQPSSVFDLPPRLVAKADPALIDHDIRHFAALTQSLQDSIAEVTAQLATALAAPGGAGQQALDRDEEVRRLRARLNALGRFGVDLCLGHVVTEGSTSPAYIGRLGITDSDGQRLLLDWRTPAAEPFFGATHAEPMGLSRRRRYRWQAGRITDYWDEAFTAEALQHTATLDDQSAFIASLGATRSTLMRDVLGTIQADQDAIIRAPAAGALVVDGGPGTGKTVVALHRAAYLLYTDPRLGHHRGGVLVIGPHQPYLDYVTDVLPSLGEEGVLTATLRDLVPEGATAAPETEPRVEALKSSLALVRAVEAAIRFYEEPPTTALTVVTEWSELRLSPADWARAFEAPESGTPHNEARDVILDELIEILLEHDADSPVEPLERALRHHRELLTTLHRAWPLLEAGDIIGDLWSVPAYLRRCAPSLDTDDVRALQRAEPQAWTEADLPLLDAARLRLGDAETDARRRQNEAEAEREATQLARVVEELLDADDDGEGALTMLRGQDMRDRLVDDSARTEVDPDRFAGPFAHIVVDEAQELTDAQWQMLLRRCPSRSFTMVGDRAQARRGFGESWADRLSRVGLERITLAGLSVNYRTPEEVMTEAEPVIRAALPDANVPTSIRRSGRPVRQGAVDELAAILDEWIAQTDAGDGATEGVACVITLDPVSIVAGLSERWDPTRVRGLTPELAKGLEFDLVVLIDPATFGAVDRYVAMTRATRDLVLLGQC